MFQVKLMVDKIKKKVIFAEAEKRLVDYLFSYLTVPMGSILNFLDGKSYIGSMDMLYQSLNKMDERFFNTEACKSKLLKPLESIGSYIEELVSRVVLHQYQKDFTELPEGGIFVEGNNTYIISDGLKVQPASLTAIQNVLDELMIKNLNGIEELFIDLDEGNLLQDLVRRSLTSTCPLSGIYFREPVTSFGSHFISKLPPILEMGLTNDKPKNFTAKLVVCESSNVVLYAESNGEDLVDLLLSFLTYPLGFIVKLLNECSTLGCMDNLYQSIDAKFIRPELLPILLNHKLAPVIGCSTSLPLIGEMSASCGTLTEGADENRHGVKPNLVPNMIPKFAFAGEDSGDGYAKKGVKFIITNNLELFPSSPSNILLTIKKHKLIAANLKEKEIQIGKYEALNLLKACLTSKNPLTDVFGKKK